MTRLEMWRVVTQSIGVFMAKKLMLVAKLSDSTVLETFEAIRDLINDSLNTIGAKTQYYFWGREAGAPAEATIDAIKSFPKQQLISRITLNYYTNNNSLFELTFQRYCVDQNLSLIHI